MAIRDHLCRLPRLEGPTLANRLAASHDYAHPCPRPLRCSKDWQTNSEPRRDSGRPARCPRPDPRAGLAPGTTESQDTLPPPTYGHAIGSTLSDAAIDHHTSTFSSANFNSLREWGWGGLLRVVPAHRRRLHGLRHGARRGRAHLGRGAQTFLNRGRGGPGGFVAARRVLVLTSLSGSGRKNATKQHHARCDVLPPVAGFHKKTRRQVQAAGPAWALGPEDPSNIETEIPSHVEIEPIEPRPIPCRRGASFKGRTAENWRLGLSPATMLVETAFRGFVDSGGLASPGARPGIATAIATVSLPQKAPSAKNGFERCKGMLRST